MKQTGCWQHGTAYKLIERVRVRCRSLLVMLSLLAGVSVAGAQGVHNTTFLGMTEVNPLSPPTAVITLTAQTSGIISLPVLVLTSGIPNLEFNLAATGSSAGTCSQGMLMNAGQSCSVTVSFSPQYPGVRQGAVVLETGDEHSPTVLAEALLSGMGQGGLPMLMPGTINTVAGDSQWLYEGDNVQANAASIFLPSGLAVDAAGDLYLCDTNNNRVRRVDASSGLISTVAGNGISGNIGDGGPAISAEMSGPSGLALDGAGNLYIADSGNNAIRRVDAVTGVITTVAGTLGTSGYTGDNGAATNAKLTSPQGIALAPDGNLIIADTGNAAVRLLTFATGQITGIAGTGMPGYNGDSGPASLAQLNHPSSVAVNARIYSGGVQYTLAIADRDNQRIRLVDTAGTISTMAGTGVKGYGADGQAATQAQLNSPAAVAFDPAGDLFIADSGNNRIRGVLESGDIYTLAGNGNEGLSGDGGPDNQASFYGPSAVVFDSLGNLWVSDMFNNHVRKVTGTLLSLTYPTMKVGKTSAPIQGALFNAGNVKLTLQTPVLTQAALDPGLTTCLPSLVLAPTYSCTMGIDFAPTQVGNDETGSVTWRSDAPNITPVDTLNGEVLDVEPTTTTLLATPNPGMLGQPVTLTASIVSNNSTVTGTVTFSEDNKIWCTEVSVARSGTGLEAASCSVSGLSLGSHTFLANYSGDSDDAASMSQPYTEIIKEAPVLTLSVSPNPAEVTSDVILTLTATSSSGTPSGTVVFYDGATALATVALSSEGIAIWSAQTLSLGTHQLSAHYNGDNANSADTSNVVLEPLVTIPTVTVLSSNNAIPMVGIPVTFTATVKNSLGSLPGGAVVFVDGSGAQAPVLGTVTLSASGVASFVTEALTPGAHSITVVYSGDTDDAPSSSNVLQENVQTSGITLVSSSNPSVSGLNVLFSAQLKASGVLSPEGMVDFRDNGVLLSSATFSSLGVASVATTGLSVGTHLITASYAGDNTYVAAGAQLTQLIVQASTTTTLSASANTATYGQPLSLTANVTTNGGTAGGVVNFVDGAQVIGSAQLDEHGAAVLTISTLAPGAHAVVAKYMGNSNDVASTSTALALVVKQSTALLVTADSNPVETLSTISFTATVKDAGAAPVTGAVSFSDGATVIGTAQVDASGHATLTLLNLVVGTHSIVANYPGDGANFNSSSTVYTENVELRPTTTTVTGSSTNPANPQQLTLIAVVAGQGSKAPTGTVSFTSGNLTLGVGSIGPTGVAAVTVLFETASQQIVASYSGDSSYAASNSSSSTIAAGQAAQFTVTVDSPNISIITHQHTTINVTVASVGGFTDTIALGCLGLPYAATCTFNSDKLALASNGVGTTSLIIDTGDPLGAGTAASLKEARGTTLICFLPMGVLLGVAGRKRRHLRRTWGTLLFLAVTCATAICVTGCSGLTTSGTPPGTYSFKVIGRGQGSGTTEAQTVTLTVTR